MGINYKDLFDFSPFGMVVISTQGVVQEANDSFCKMIGYNLEECKKCGFGKIILQDDSASVFDNDLLVVERLVRDSIQKIRLKKKDNKILEVYFKAKLQQSKESSCPLILFQVVEVVNSLQVEEVLKQETGLLDAVMESFPAEIFIKNKASEFIKVNNATRKKLKNGTPEEIFGKTDFDYFTDEHASRAFDVEQKIIKTKKALLNFEEKECYPDGKVIYLNTSKMPLIDRDGKTIGVVGITQDITQRKIYELELKEKTSILQAIASKMPVVIYKYVKEQGLQTLFGSDENLKGFESSKVAKLKVADSLIHLVGKIGSQKNRYGYFNFYSTSKINKKECYFDNFIFEGEEAGQFIGFALDITERKHIEQKLKRDAKNMEKINRELNQFAYIISHDLKAPLRAITNLSEWIEEDLEGTQNKEVKENLGLLRGRVNRMENLINGILKYSRLTRSELVYEKVDVGALLEDMIEYLMIPDTFQINLPKNLPTIIFSKIHLEQIFTNLLTNAVKHHDRDGGTINIEYKEVNGMHEFMVGDDGPGISSEYHEKVFQIFQTLQARDSFESTGIGLTIVKKIVEEQGGAVSLKSELGSGSKFYFTLPKIARISEIER